MSARTSSDERRKRAQKVGSPSRNGDGKHERGPSQSTQLVELAQAAEYCHDPDSKAFARMDVEANGKTHKETWPVRSAGFRSWLCRLYYVKTGKAPSAQAMQDALGILEARGRFDGESREVFVRLGKTEADHIVLDLGDALWRCVVVTPDGWSVEAESPVLFRRPRGLMPLPVPERGGSLETLKGYLNIQKEHWPLVVGWSVASMFPAGPHPVLGLHGEQGAAKSTTARVLRSLFDPSKAPLRCVPRDERDIIISASNSWVLAIDNLSSLHEWLSDALCRVATGSGFSTRELFSDDEEVILNVCRPIVITGIEDLASRPDLMDRSVILHLPKIDERGRQTEKEFWKQFESDRPRILGALLDVLAGALHHLPEVKLESLPRMADFAVRAVAACRALDWPDAAFLNAYAANQADAFSASLDENILREPLWSFMKAFCLPWEGPWQQLLDGITARAGDRAKSPRWPKDTRQLSGMLRRFAPVMRKGGYEVELDLRGPAPDRERRVRLSRPEGARNSSSTSSTSSTAAADAGRGMDGMDAMDGEMQTDSPFPEYGKDGKGDAYEGDG